MHRRTVQTFHQITRKSAIVLVLNPLSCANVASQGPALIIVSFIRNFSAAFQCCYPLHLQNVSGDCMWQDFCAKSPSSAAGSSIMVTSCLNRRVSAPSLTRFCQSQCSELIGGRSNSQQSARGQSELNGRSIYVETVVRTVGTTGSATGSTEARAVELSSSARVLNVFDGRASSFRCTSEQIDRIIT